MNDLRVVWHHFRLSIMNELAYRANLMLQILQVAIRLGLTFVGVAVIYAHTETLGGWRPPELIALVGVYFLVDGLINLVIEPNMVQLMESIRAGTFDFALTKPVDTQVLVSGQTVAVWKVVDVIAGIFILVSALVRLGASVSIGRVFAFAVTLLAGAAIIYSVLLMMATLTFWLVNIDNILVIFQSMYEAGRWPVTIYPQWLQLTLTFLIPVAFAVTVPTEALIGRLTWVSGGITVLVAAVLVVVSRLLWTRGIRRYSGASA